jgi:hypothetical protein
MWIVANSEDLADRMVARRLQPRSPQEREYNADVVGAAGMVECSSLNLTSQSPG